jgi:hypothetical protein
MKIINITAYLECSGNIPQADVVHLLADPVNHVCHYGRELEVIIATTIPR